MLIITKTPPRKPGRYRPRQPGEPLRGGALRRPYAGSNHRWGRRPCSCLGLLSAPPPYVVYLRWTPTMRQPKPRLKV
jgi:hypothetical protein